MRLGLSSRSPWGGPGPCPCPTAHLHVHVRAGQAEGGAWVEEADVHQLAQRQHVFQPEPDVLQGLVHVSRKGVLAPVGAMGEVIAAAV